MYPCSKFHHLLQIRQMLRRWRKKAAMGRRRAPADVPAGHVAVTVGSDCSRFVIRATYLNHPLFKELLARAEEEYGFGHLGPLVIPCVESVFEEISRYVARSELKKNTAARAMIFHGSQRCCIVGFGNDLKFWADSQPIMNCKTDSSIC